MPNGNDPKDPHAGGGHITAKGSGPNQPPQLRLFVISGIGGFLGALIGALIACHLCR